MRNVPPPLHLPSRSGDDWLVGEEEKDALLKAPVKVDPNQPPTTGWQFYNNGNFKEDESISCTNQTESPCCSITVSLSGEAKETHDYDVIYESTGLISMGRQVNQLISTQPHYHFFIISFAGIQTGWRQPHPLYKAWRENLVHSK